MKGEDDIVPVSNRDGPRMVRPHVEAADSLIGVRHSVLEHGYVVLVDYMGDDAAIVQAARVSYGAGTRSVRDDRGLIRYLMRHQHTTPFEMVEFKFLIRLPIYVARQFIRHRTVSVNETSARYSVMPDEYDLPRPEAVRGQSVRNRQGRAEEPLPARAVEKFRQDIVQLNTEAYRVYREALEAGIAREIARISLPVGYYTEWYWKVNLHNIFHFLKLRLDDHAQEEIRAYARVMADIVRAVVPVAYEAFEDFTLNSQSFSRLERAALVEMVAGADPREACEHVGLPLKKADGSPMRTGEGVEFLDKVARLRKSGPLAGGNVRDPPKKP